jgi:hypothetical protein
MSEQRELFETGKRSCRKRHCPFIPPDVRQEVLAVLALMGKEFLQAERKKKASLAKENRDES